MKKLTGEARIYNRGGLEYLKRIHFKTESDFFDRPIKWSLEDEFLVLKPADLDDTKNIIEVKRTKVNNYQTVISFLKCDFYPPNGPKEFDEDSNEDEVLIKL